MARRRKITLEVPRDLLGKAHKASGMGVTQTVCAGLQLVAASGAHARLRKFCGKVQFSRTAAELRSDGILEKRRKARVSLSPESKSTTEDQAIILIPPKKRAGKARILVDSKTGFPALSFGPGAPRITSAQVRKILDE